MSGEPATAVDTDPREMIDLDLATLGARLVDDDGRIVIAIHDADGVAYLSARANPDAERHLRRLRVQLEHLEAEVRRRTISWREGPFNGPGAS